MNILTINERLLKLKEDIGRDPTNLKLKKKFYELEFQSVTTRSEALKLGWSIYNDKKRCKNGHYSDRRTSDGKCIKCTKTKRNVSSEHKKIINQYFVTHSPIFNVENASLFLNEILSKINKDYPSIKLDDILKEKVKISSELYRYFIKAPDDLIATIDEMSIKSIKGK